MEIPLVPDAILNYNKRLNRSCCSGCADNRSKRCSLVCWKPGTSLSVTPATLYARKEPFTCWQRLHRIFRLAPNQSCTLSFRLYSSWLACKNGIDKTYPTQRKYAANSSKRQPVQLH